MRGNSPQVVSSQTGVHPRLPKVVKRLLHSEHLRPLRDDSKQACKALRPWFARYENCLILDSCCGTGRSSELLATANPDCGVLAIDKSLARLTRSRMLHSSALSNTLFSQVRENLIFLRSPCYDVWRLLVEEYHLTLKAHYLLYPNPWPKPAHLQRRWYAHPAFLWLLRLGGTLEIRSNWQLYIEEAATAFALAGVANDKINSNTFWTSQPITTNFEEKYLASGHQLYQLSATISNY